jgi:hypothetical protein
MHGTGAPAERCSIGAAPAIDPYRRQGRMIGRM